MSTGVAAMKIPDNPPIANIATKATAWSIGTWKRRLPRHIVPIQLNTDRKSTRLNSSHSQISYAVFCLKKKKRTHQRTKSGAKRSRTILSFNVEREQYTQRATHAFCVLPCGTCSVVLLCIVRTFVFSAFLRFFFFFFF